MQLPKMVQPLGFLLGLLHSLYWLISPEKFFLRKVVKAPALPAAQKAEVRRMCDEELRPLAEIALLFRVSAKTVRRV